MNKLKDHAFRKDVYLLGEDAEGMKYWLEAPSWDCGWYWGFGYVETYQNNSRPSRAVDIDSHQHASGKYGADNVLNDTNIFTGNFLTEKTFSNQEGWQLRELMSTFYQLNDTAAMFGRGGVHVASNPLKLQLKDVKLVAKINEKLIPAITGKILEILTPETKQ